MGKISTYPTDTSVSAGDKVIGTDNDSSSATKNYVMSDIAAYVAGTIPDPTLESVLTAGNTATEDINLSGDVNAVGVTANGVSCSTLASTTISVTGQFLDSNGLSGTSGQVLVSDGVSVSWEDRAFVGQVSVTVPAADFNLLNTCLLYTSPSPRDRS